jgi:dTDP-4-amino-4,6-dideoxygalactose transaminase
MLWVQALVYRMAVYPRTTAFIQEVFRYLTKLGVVVGSSKTSEFAPVMEADFFKGMSAVQARRGIRQLRRLEQNIAHRRNMARLYDELLTGKGWRPRGYDRSAMDPVMVRYPVRITEKDRALSEAGKAGVEIGSWFECPLHPKETPLAAYDYEAGMCPQGEKASREVVNLPLHPRTSEATIRRTVEFITKFTQARYG